MRFYIMTDLEGVSGVVDFDLYCSADSLLYEKAKRLLTLEVNAAIEGILSTGNHEIVVIDGHGAGAIDIELLHKEASLIIGRPLKYMFEMDNGKYDAFLMIGQHAMKGAHGANLDHTFNHLTIKSLAINGIKTGEAAINALRAGIFNIPTIYLSGDDAACEEIQSLIPEICTCSVKRGITTTSAECLQPEKAREKIRHSVIQAIRNIDKIKPLSFSPPYEAVIDFFNIDSTAPYDGKDYCRISKGDASVYSVYIEAKSMKELLEKNLWGF